MNRRKSLSGVCFLITLYLFVLEEGCLKEYSYKGGPQLDSSLVRDSGLQQNTVGNGIAFPACKNCNNFSAALKWSFKANGSVLCGMVTKAIKSSDGGAITFFGPSACSQDSGLIITAYFQNEKLTRDRTNLAATRAALEYYDNLSQTDVLQSRSPVVFSLTMEHYQILTGMAEGNFSGLVVDKMGNNIKVEAGKFTVKF